jgi:homoserine O-acetyltransferase
MGGMQAMQWAVSYPGFVRGCMPIAATASLSTQALAFDAVGRHAITSDPHWGAGNYYEKTTPEKGLGIARMIGHITYLSDESMTIKFGRKLQEKADYGYDFTTDFQIESYLKYQGDKFVNRFDANSYLYLTKAISYFDLAKQYGALENAFKNVTSRFLVVAIDSDWLYPPRQSKDVAKALMHIGKAVSYAELHSAYGHDAFLIPNPELDALVENFLYALD